MRILHTIYTLSTHYLHVNCVQVAAQPEHDPVPAPRPWAVDTWYYVEHVSSSSQQLPVSLAVAVVVVAVLC